jgi:hypothetical protein
MNDMAALRQAVDQLLGGRLDPLVELLAENVEFDVAGGGEVPRGRTGWGVPAVEEYFGALGELTAFWQIDYGAVDGQVIAWGRESFRIEGCGLEGECEFALVFDLAGGRIVRLQVVEDLPAFVRKGGLLPTRDAA